MRPTIVCGVDRSPNARAAAHLASGLARRLGLRLKLIHVLDRDSDQSSHGGRAAMRSLTEEHLDLHAAIHLKSGFAPHVLAEAGRDATLLVIGTRGEGALRQALLGGVSAELTRDPSIPLVVVPPGAADIDALLDGQTIVCGVRDERDIAPAHVAGKLASDLGVSLTLAHVLGQSPMPISTEAPAPLMARPTGEGFDAAVRTLQSIARSLAINIPVHIDLDVLNGHPGLQLERTAAARRATMLAVGACDQAALAGALARTPPWHLMRHGARPVLVCPRRRRLASTRTRTGDQISSLSV